MRAGISRCGTGGAKEEQGAEGGGEGAPEAGGLLGKRGILGGKGRNTWGRASWELDKYKYNWWRQL